MKQIFKEIRVKVEKNVNIIILILLMLMISIVGDNINQIIDLRNQVNENNKLINQLIDKFETAAPANTPAAAEPVETAAQAETAAPAEASPAGEEKREALLRTFPELAPVLQRLEKAIRMGDNGAEFIRHHMFLHSPDPKDRVEEEAKLLVLEYQLCGLADHPGNGLESFDLSKDLGHRANALPALAVLQSEGWVVINSNDRPQWTAVGYLNMMTVIDWYLTNY